MAEQGLDGARHALEVAADNGNDNDDRRVEVVGLSMCAASLVFRVGTTAIRTNPQTRFDGITCGALGAGDAIEVHGTPQADGSLLASRIESDE